jgi:hypothetical protein
MVREVTQGSQTSELEDTPADKPYKWYEMGFFTHWDDSDCCRVLCIDTPKELQRGLHTVLQNQSPHLDFADPFVMHVPLIDQIILLYDDSVWRVRDPVRKIEKVYTSIMSPGRDS